MCGGSIFPADLIWIIVQYESYDIVFLRWHNISPLNLLYMHIYMRFYKDFGHPRIVPTAAMIPQHGLPLFEARSLSTLTTRPPSSKLQSQKNSTRQTKLNIYITYTYINQHHANNNMAELERHFMCVFSSFLLDSIPQVKACCNVLHQRSRWALVARRGFQLQVLALGGAEFHFALRN